MWGCQHLHALRRAGQERINVPGYFAERFVKRNNVRAPAAKNQSFMDLHARYVHESVFGKIEILGNVSVKCCCHKPARIAGPLPNVTAWTMSRGFTGQGTPYKQLLSGLAV